jgi:hypothetical protein
MEQTVKSASELKLYKTVLKIDSDSDRVLKKEINPADRLEA